MGDHRFEYTKIDKVLKGFAERLPDRYWLPRVHLYAPKWWLDEHPAEAVGYCIPPPEDGLEQAFPPFGGLHKQSFASELWRQEAGEGLRRLVRDLSPRFVPRASGQTVWGTYSDDQEPALVVRDMGQWRSAYSPTAHLPWAVLNRIYRDAGVHLYAEQGDNLSVNESWLMLHTAKDSAGQRHISLPRPMPVYDVIGERLVTESSAEFTVDLPSATTALYAFADLGATP